MNQFYNRVVVDFKLYLEKKPSSKTCTANVLLLRNEFAICDDGDNSNYTSLMPF